MLGIRFTNACFKQDMAAAKACLLELQKIDINRPLADIAIDKIHIKGSPLFMAAFTGFADIIPELINAGAWVDTGGEVLDKATEKTIHLSSLSIAVRKLHINVVEVLLKANAATSYVDTDHAVTHTIFYDLAQSYYLADDVNENREKLMRIFASLKIAPEENWVADYADNLLIHATKNGDIDIALLFLEYIEEFYKRDQFPHKSALHQEKITAWLFYTKAIALKRAFEIYEVHPGASVQIAKVLRHFQASFLKIIDSDVTFAEFMQNKPGLMRALFPKESELFVSLFQFARDIFGEFKLAKDVHCKSKRVISFFPKIFSCALETENFVGQMQNLLVKLNKMTMRAFLVKAPGQIEAQSKFSDIKKEFLIYLHQYEQMLKGKGDYHKLMRLHRIKNKDTPVEVEHKSPAFHLSRPKF